MTSVLLSPGELTLADKLQSKDFIDERAAKLRNLYELDPDTTRDVISMVYPHTMKRPWEHAELQEALKTDPVVKTAFQKFAAEFLASKFPSMAAAIDAYKQSREYQDALAEQRDIQRFPALHASQSELARRLGR